MIKLRHYQQSAIDGLYKYFMHEDGSPLVVMPTGTGKAFTICAFIQKAITEYPSTRILNLTHVKELIEQNYESMIKLWWDAPAGIYSAGLNSRDLKSQIIFGGIQSIYKRAAELGKVDLIIVDEAHTMSRNNNSMYGRFIDEVKILNPSVKLIGFTATPYRLQCGMLHEGDDRLFHGIAYDYSIKAAIDEGYLCEVRTKQTETVLDVSGVKKVGGEFQEKSLQAAIDVDETTQAAVAEIVKLGEDRGSWIVFCAGVSHAEHVRDAIRAHDISCETITGSTPDNQRQAILRAFKAGKIRAVTNVGVLTTGFDAPGTDLVAALRPTQSPGLWVQMLGRGMRIAEGKEDCLVLDFAGNTLRHGPIDKIETKDGRSSGEGEAPIKICPECDEIVYAGVNICPSCEYQFPPQEVDIDRTAAVGALLSHQNKPVWCDVSDVKYFRHKKQGKLDSVRVEYRCGLTIHKQWVNVHYARGRNWWYEREKGTPIPQDTDEALGRVEDLPTPKRILVKKEGKYTSILETEF